MFIFQRKANRRCRSCRIRAAAAVTFGRDLWWSARSVCNVPEAGSQRSVRSPVVSDLASGTRSPGFDPGCVAHPTCALPERVANNAVFAFLYGLATTGLSTPGGWTAWVTLILEILFLIACILLLIGIKKGNVTFMKIWLLFAIILVVWELIQIIVRSVQIVGDKGFGAALAQVLGVQWVLVLIFIGVKVIYIYLRYPGGVFLHPNRHRRGVKRIKLKKEIHQQLC
ncbi:Hypp6028 [Branchiostoma lanceolatum]|uniref:Hypp6028 protein n=1 Tax=Branchiostoma lanceolatum TaxID=7740 RepID=A0A8J9VHI0_BRALA|nr:Hypp6028 [Branchiostoma lanceolatum]